MTEIEGMPSPGKDWSVSGIQSQILVTVGQREFIINPGNRLVRRDEDIHFDEVIDILSGTGLDDFVDLWGAPVDLDGGDVFFVRLFGRNVVLLTQVFSYPDSKDLVQS